MDLYRTGASDKTLMEMSAALDGFDDGSAAAQDALPPAIARGGQVWQHGVCFPDQDPMPEAWDDAPYGGVPARSSRGTMHALEACLGRGDLQEAARWLDPSSFNVRELRRRNVASWNARHALAQARYDLMRAYEAIHGAGCLLQPEHRSALVRAWNPFGAVPDPCPENRERSEA